MLNILVSYGSLSTIIMRYFFVIVVFVMSEPLYAASRTTIVTEIQRGDNLEKRIEVIAVDGEKARIDMHLGNNPDMKNSPYMLTVDNGKTWVLDDNQTSQSACIKWDLKIFFNQMGELMSYAEDLAGAEVSDGVVDVLLDEAGPKILGNETRHLRINSSMNAKAQILFYKREYTLEFKDEIWVSNTLKLHPIEQAWIDAMSHTGYAKIDRQSQVWNEQVPGTILKLISDVTLFNITKNKKRVKRETIEVTKIENLKTNEIPPATFNVPSCDEVTEDEMEERAKVMLKAIAR